MYAADAIHPNPTLEEKLQSIYGLRDGPLAELTIRKPYLDLLQILGDPHKHLPPVIHVAGTNGKGSVIATMRAILEKADYCVHIYTSPHLHRFNERIVLAGTEISDRYLEDCLSDVLSLKEAEGLTFFEITTALAFMAFSRIKADILLLETGLGGRLDCTNVVEDSLATVITTISYDHMDFLGHSLPEIAAEKAGIMKKGAPCIIGTQKSASIDTLFRSKAAKRGCPLYRCGIEWRTEPHDTQIRFVSGSEEIILPHPNLTGAHQVENAALAVACLQIIDGFDIPEHAIKQGIQSVDWPGRLERIDTDFLPPEWELWFDCGHNEAAGKALARQAGAWEKQDGKELHLIVGMMKHKDPEAFLKHLLPLAKSLIIVPIKDEPQAMPVQELAVVARQLSGVPVYESSDMREALKGIVRDKEGTDSRILITGSLYLAKFVVLC